MPRLSISDAKSIKNKTVHLAKRTAFFTTKNLLPISQIRDKITYRTFQSCSQKSYILKNADFCLFNRKPKIIQQRQQVWYLRRCQSCLNSVWLLGWEVSDRGAVVSEGQISRLRTLDDHLKWLRKMYTTPISLLSIFVRWASVLTTMASTSKREISPW